MNLKDLISTIDVFSTLVKGGSQLMPKKPEISDIIEGLMATPPKQELTDSEKKKLLLEEAKKAAAKKGLKLVPLVIKPVSANGVYDAVKFALQADFNLEGNVDIPAQILCSQIWAETGLKRVSNNNVGHIKGWGSKNKFWNGDVTVITIHDVGRKVRTLETGLDVKWDFFRSYPTLREGVRDYVRLLNIKRYKPALEAAQRGDIEGFVKMLKKGGYFTANVDKYLSLVRKSYNAFQNKLKKERII